MGPMCISLDLNCLELYRTLCLVSVSGPIVSVSVSNPTVSVSILKFDVSYISLLFSDVMRILDTVTNEIRM